MTSDCDKCDGEAEGNYFDCPGFEAGTCDPTMPHADCPDCGGKGYIAPPVKCHCDEGAMP